MNTFYELKATTKNVGVASFNNQLRFQLSALSLINTKLKKQLVVVTTSGIKLTRNLRKEAAGKNIYLYHQEAYYNYDSSGKLILDFKLNIYD